ncbi:TPA: hypothetical protein KRA45_002436, partial [Clostridioides difficile]|nr:hypothetical protein [Clostridioides difficile]
MNNDKPFIDIEEEIDFILTECEKERVSIDRDTVEFILDLDLKFLELKGVVTYTEESEEEEIYIYSTIK